ncbi:MAG: SDR family oxidoreductase [Mollicutes bacterium]|nr:SDR family oxidoreductase [Mollicutes bacterium]
MKILITGSNGFVGKNLRSHLSLVKDIEIFEFHRGSTLKDLDKYTKECDFIYHLAGVNRPKKLKEFMEGNHGFTSTLLSYLSKNNNKSPIVFSSSIQAEFDNEYGQSKKAVEELLSKYSQENDIKVLIYRFPNLFGKWCKPNYNSVIATWCYNVANDIDISIDNPETVLNLAYIDDVCKELVKCIEGKETHEGNYCIIPTIYSEKLGEIASLIKSFKENAFGIMVPSTGNDFIKKLYSTYASYVPVEKLIVDLIEHRDDRGVFCELIRTKESGQISISTTNPNIIRGGHYHNTKMERFIVIKGKAKIRFEHVIDHSSFEFLVSGDKLQYVTIPVGYLHSINNVGKEELILILWANELFDVSAPDTYVMEESDDQTKKL